MSRNQQVPLISGADVARVVRREFSARDVEQAEALLEAMAGPDPQRIRMAILKLAKGDIERLAHVAKNARTDSRDVLAWAESDAYLRLPLQCSESDRSRAIESDWAEYQRWLHKR